ncbi:hypothetical protein N305_12479, partial [Manacus vitellinus]
QHGIELGVMEHNVHRVVVKLGDGLEGSAVIRVHEGQVLHVEDVHDVRPVALVDGDPGVPALHNLRHSVEVQDGIAADHKAVGQRGHHVLHRLGAQLQRTLDHVQFLLDQIIERLRHLQHLQEPL